MSASDDEPSPILVCHGRFSTAVGGFFMLGAFLGTAFAVTVLLNAASEPGGLPWLGGARTASSLRFLNPAFDSLIGVCVGLAVAWIVGTFMEHRVGRVDLLEDGIRWRVRAHEPDDVVPWERFEGFRDTPHPWVEVLTRKGVARTIPVSTEAAREVLVGVLQRFLTDLGRPADERNEPGA